MYIEIILFDDQENAINDRIFKEIDDAINYLKTVREDVEEEY